MTETLCAAFLLVAAAGPTSAQTAPQPGASVPEQAPGGAKPITGEDRKAEGARITGEDRKAEGAAKREPSPGRLAAQERRRKCGAEWKDATAAGKVAAEMKWPKFYSECNTRLKDGKA